MRNWWQTKPDVFKPIKANKMKCFAISCLVIIIIVIQHLLNWLWRKVGDRDDLIAGAIIFTIFAIFISWILAYHIWLWQ